MTDSQFVDHLLGLETHRELMNELAKYAAQERYREMILAEIQKRRLDDIFRSSETLKLLTCVLIALTVILGILAVPPFVETVKRLSSGSSPVVVHDCSE